jgi:hypothetical protein
MKSTAITTLLAAFFLASCVKTRTCECTRTNLSTGGTTQDNYTVKTTKKYAKEACKNYLQEDSFEKVTCTLE